MRKLTPGLSPSRIRLAASPRGPGAASRCCDMRSRPQQEATERGDKEGPPRHPRVRRAEAVVLCGSALAGHRWRSASPTVGPALSEVQQNDNTAFLLPRSAESTTVSGLTAAFNPRTPCPCRHLEPAPEGLMLPTRPAHAGSSPVGRPHLCGGLGKALGPSPRRGPAGRPLASRARGRQGAAGAGGLPRRQGFRRRSLGIFTVLFEARPHCRASAKETRHPSGSEGLLTGPGGTARRLRHGVRWHRRHPARRRLGVVLIVTAAFAVAHRGVCRGRPRHFPCA